MAEYVGAVDQGTTSTRFMIFDHSGNEVGRHQLEHEQILPQAGWVEHNPVEIWERTSAVLQSALNKVNLQPSDLAALGITNQRETAVVWDKRTGRGLVFFEVEYLPEDREKVQEPMQEWLESVRWE